MKKSKLEEELKYTEVRAQEAEERLRKAIVQADQFKERADRAEMALVGIADALIGAYR